MYGWYGIIPGELKIQKQRLSFTAIGPVGLFKRQLKGLERDVNRPGLAEALDNGEAAEVFEVSVSESGVDFPKWAMSSLMHVWINGVKLRVSLFPASAYNRVHGPASQADIADAFEVITHSVGNFSAYRKSSKAVRQALNM